MRIFFICLFSFLFVNTQAQEAVYLTGTIDNPVVDSAFLYVKDLYIDQGSEEYVIEINQNGEFDIIFEVNNPGFVDFVIDSQLFVIYIQAGDSINIQISNTQEANEIIFDGIGTGNNQFFKEFSKEFGAQIGVKSMSEAILNTDIDRFEISIFDNRLKHLEYIEKYKSKEKLTREFITFFNYYIEYNYLALLMAYPIINGNNSSAANVKALPEVMTNKITDNIVNNQKAMSCVSYREFIYYYVVYYTSKEHDFAKFSDMNLSMSYKCNFAKNNLNGKLRLYFIAKYLIDNCNQVSSDVFEKNRQILVNILESEKYLQIIDSRRLELLAADENKQKKQKKDDKEKPDTKSVKNSGKHPLKLNGLDGKTVSIDDFKGKVIYIDFWASWCGPCRQQIPHAKALKKKLSAKQEKEIVFLYISIDDDETRWRDAIKKNEIEGVHVISPGGWGSEVTKYFKISSIPRYMIIDKKGNIVDDNAKRPSSEGILNDLLMLIK